MAVYNFVEDQCLISVVQRIEKTVSGEQLTAAIVDYYGHWIDTVGKLEVLAVPYERAMAKGNTLLYHS